MLRGKMAALAGRTMGAISYRQDPYRQAVWGICIFIEKPQMCVCVWVGGRSIVFDTIYVEVLSLTFWSKN